jgi:DNA helicase II / ATP-dependent DNA helicase PcrA
VLRSHGYLISERKGVSLLLPAQARGRLAGVPPDDREVALREIFKKEGRISFDLFPALVADLFDRLPLLAKAYAQAYPLIRISMNGG